MASLHATINTTSVSRFNRVLFRVPTDNRYRFRAQTSAKASGLVLCDKGETDMFESFVGWCVVLFVIVPAVLTGVGFIFMLIAAVFAGIWAGVKALFKTEE